MPKINLVSDELTPSQVMPVERAKSVLNRAGLSDLTTVRSDITAALNSSGATPTDCAIKLASIMNFGDSDKLQLAATKEVLKLHGAYGESAGEDGRVIFVIDGDTQINQMFNPQRNS